MKKIFLGLITVFAFSSCEDVITVDVEKGTTQLAVDAFLSNKNEAQKIVLNETKQFFENVSQEAFVADSVYVTDNVGNKYIFEASVDDGVYIWDDSVLVHEAREYELTIKQGSLVYKSSTEANPVPSVDSINWEYVPAGLGQDNGGYAAELVARDLPGQFDYYWVRFLKNGKYDTRLEGLNVSVDGSFSEASRGDGQLFIAPISTFTAYNLDDSLGIGDFATYELWSISEKTFKFWQEVQNQAIQGGGIGALFATPTANTSTNVRCTTSEELEDQPVGWFSVSVVSSTTQEIIDDPNEKLSFDIN